MKRNPITAATLLAVLAAIAVGSAGAEAAETTVTTTTQTVTTTRPMVLQGSIITAPQMTVEGLSGKTVVAQSPFPIQMVKYVSASGQTIYYVGARDDLSIRRDDLMARILIERADGDISSGASSDFMDRLVRIDAQKSSTPSNSRSRAYFEHVLGTYQDYGKLAQDMKSASHKGDKQLASTYSYTVF
ncbi:MAG: hypothetical protein SFV17_05175 [Candidatus Obscuribacter sp.]|nr:hypothetical protein [Candidatus Melainabacteria bacterium]MDX1986058.1 hypothetical protein [Candidatus Obscuribacter sp.]